jgi:cysteine-rich repeat protein
MRRLGLVLGLTACVPSTGESSTQVVLDTSTTAVDDSGSGVFTVTSDASHSGPASSDTSSTNGDASSTGVSTDTSSTGAPGSSSSGSSSGEVSTGPAGFCGDGKVDVGEECDDGNADEIDQCTTKCRPPSCGDDILQPGEICDDGNLDENDDCTSKCKLSVCGDGILREDTEECDDANAVDTDACLSTCKVAICGDNKVWAGKEVCDDGFNTNDYGGCAVGCKSKASEYCGDNKVQELYEHCDGPTNIAGVGCGKTCRYNFSTVPQLSCNLTCSWAGANGCDQADADVFCKLRTGKPQAKATKWDLALPTDLGGFACADPNVFFPDDMRINLGPLPEFGVLKDVRYQPTKIKSTHGPTVKVIQASTLTCTQ